MSQGIGHPQGSGFTHLPEAPVSSLLRVAFKTKEYEMLGESKFDRMLGVFFRKLDSILSKGFAPKPTYITVDVMFEGIVNWPPTLLNHINPTTEQRIERTKRLHSIHNSKLRLGYDV